MTTTNHGDYFIPEPSKWPLVGTIALLFTAVGAATSIQGGAPNLVLGIGFLLIIYLWYIHKTSPHRGFFFLIVGHEFFDFN